MIVSTKVDRVNRFVFDTTISTKSGSSSPLLLLLLLVMMMMWMVMMLLIALKCVIAFVNVSLITTVDHSDSSKRLL